MTSLGRIDPVTHHQDGTPIDPEAPARPQVLRQLHEDLVRGKRRALITSLPLLALSIAALLAGGLYPEALGFLIWVGVVGVVAYGEETYDWLMLRRANPLTQIQMEARLEARRRAFEEDFRTRAAGRAPIATIALMLVISFVTIVEFVQAVRVGFPRVLESAALVKTAVRAGEWWRLLSATYLHGNLIHLLANLGSLVVLGEMLETYEERTRVPLVYLVAAVTGSVGSTLLTSRTSVGASGGILGIAGYLVAAAGRSHRGTPLPVRGRMLRFLAATAVMGLAGIAFVDNGGHLGGFLGGVAVAYVLPHGTGRRERLASALGTGAAGVLVAGAAFTVYRLAQ